MKSMIKKFIIITSNVSSRTEKRYDDTLGS